MQRKIKRSNTIKLSTENRIYNVKLYKTSASLAPHAHTRPRKRVRTRTAGLELSTLVVHYSSPPFERDSDCTGGHTQCRAKNLFVCSLSPSVARGRTSFVYRRLIDPHRRRRRRL